MRQVINGVAILLLFAAALAWLAPPAHSETERIWTLNVNGAPGSLASIMRLQPTKEPGAAAELVFENKNLHNFDKEEFVLELDGVAVKVTLTVYRDSNDPDSVLLEPAEGYIAVPDFKLVGEDKAEVFYIYPLEGLGM